MSTLARWLSRLQLSPRSQRALTEAALDWRYEVTTAPTFAAALWRHGRAGAGFLRALASVCLESLGTLGGASWAPRFLFWSAIAVIPFAANFWSIRNLDTPLRAVTYTSLLLGKWVQMMPTIAALTVLTGRRGATSPLVGLVSIATLTALISAYGMPFLYFALAQQTNRGFGHIYTSLIGPSYVLSCVAFTASLGLFADRVRTDDRRLRASLVAIAQLPVFFLAMEPSNLILRSLGLFSESEPGRIAALIVAAAVPVSLWFYLARRQERRAALE